jgi:protocatechuate 3,4-dioxygenase beta subunit
MHRVLILLAAAASLRAGSIQGVVLEQMSGRPLARAVVRLDPVPRSGAAVQPMTLRSGRSGQFVFPAVPPGFYLLTANHEGYFPAGFGQRIATGHGVAIEVTADSTLFAELHIHHKGAITGRVFDENGVGTAGVSVLAYKARLPLVSAGSALSDDRGVYRIHGLEPGKYWIRSGAYTFDDGSGWLPTFGLAGRETHEARIQAVTVDNDTTDADVDPEPGALFHLGGRITCDMPGVVRLTLSSEMGRRRMDSGCPGRYRFEGIAPGVYEIFATSPEGTSAGFTELFLGQDSDSNNVTLLQTPTVEIEIRQVGSQAPADIPVTLIGRRQDLSEIEPGHEIPGPRTKLAPGHWEFRAQVPRGQYVESINVSPGYFRRPLIPERTSDWFPGFIESRTISRITVVVSGRSGQVSGRVTADGKPMPGAPVFLWPLAEQARRSLGGAVQTISAADGSYYFDSLPPGDYRILASFDVYEIDEEVLGMSQAQTVRVDASQTAHIDLTVWVAP